MLGVFAALAAAGLPNASSRADNASGRLLLTADRGPPGTHNTMASYMESKAALELGDETCETCTPSENTIDNCCSVGASWEGACGDGLAHTWLAGYSACNGGGHAQISTISGAKVIREKMYENNQTEADLDPESRRILQMKREEHEREAAKEAEEEATRQRARRRRQQHALLPQGSATSSRDVGPLEIAALQVPRSAPVAIDTTQPRYDRKANGHSDRSLNVVSRLGALINACSNLTGDCSAVSDFLPGASCNVSHPSLKPCARLVRTEALQRPKRILSYGCAMGVEAEVLLAYYRRAAGCGAGCSTPPIVTCSDIDTQALRIADEAFASKQLPIEVQPVHALKRDSYDIVYCNFVLFQRMSSTEYGDFVEQLLQFGAVVVVVSYVTDGWAASKFHQEESLGAYQQSERAVPTVVFVDGNMFFAVHWSQGGLSLSSDTSLFDLPPREVCGDAAASQTDWIWSNTPCSQAQVDEWAEGVGAGDFRR